MTSLHSPTLLDALRSGGDLDFMREPMQLVRQALIDLGANETIGAACYERTDNRSIHRNGSRSRLLSTRPATSSWPSLSCATAASSRPCWSRVGASTGPCGVIMEAFVHGVSTRKVDDLAVMLGAAWQRCRVHFMRNVLARVPRGSQEMLAAAIRTSSPNRDAAAVADQLDSISGRPTN